MEKRFSRELFKNYEFSGSIQNCNLNKWMKAIATLAKITVTFGLFFFDFGFPLLMLFRNFILLKGIMNKRS